MNKQKTIITSLLIFGVIIVITVISEPKTHYARKLFDNLVLDNRNHYLSCNQLPTVEHVDKVVREHKDVVEQIIRDVGKRYGNKEAIPLWENNTVTGGKSFYIAFSWGEPYPECQDTGRGDIQITYPAHQDRVIIQRIINDSTFFGIPYRLKNV